jgi:hypothetical protein
VVEVGLGVRVAEEGVRDNLYDISQTYEHKRDTVSCATDTGFHFRA